MKANYLITIPHKYATKFKWDMSNQKLWDGIEDMIKLKPVLITMERSRVVHISFITSEEYEDPYKALIQMFPKHTYYDISISNKWAESHQIVDILEMFSLLNVKSIRILHIKACDIAFTNEEAERISILLSTDNWKERIEILELYFENSSMLPKLLRVATQLKSLKELEIKWKSATKKIKACNNVIKRKSKIFNRLTRFIFEQWIK